MHRHGYKGRKFGRKADQRGALIRGLVSALFIHTSIKTTTARAKEIRPIAEKIITHARRNTLFSRRIVISKLGSAEVARQLIDIIVPQLKRTSGYLRIEPAGSRRGDNAEMSTISFVDPIDLTPKAKNPEPAKTSKPAPKKPAAKKTTPAKTSTKPTTKSAKKKEIKK